LTGNSRDDGTFLSATTYEGIFAIDWEYALGGSRHDLRFNGAEYSAADEETFPGSFTPIPIDWAAFAVRVSIVGSLLSAFHFVIYQGKKYWTSYNKLDIIDIYFSVTVPSPGISFSSTHGSAGGDGIGGSSLAI